jgi:hypothetical protein
MGKSTINVPFSIGNCVSLPEGFSGFSHRTQCGKCSLIDPAWNPTWTYLDISHSRNASSTIVAWIAYFSFGNLQAILSKRHGFNHKLSLKLTMVLPAMFVGLKPHESCRYIYQKSNSCWSEPDLANINPYKSYAHVLWILENPSYSQWLIPINRSRPAAARQCCEVRPTRDLRNAQCQARQYPEVSALPKASVLWPLRKRWEIQGILHLLSMVIHYILVIIVIITQNI